MLAMTQRSRRPGRVALAALLLTALPLLAQVDSKLQSYLRRPRRQLPAIGPARGRGCLRRSGSARWRRSARSGRGRERGNRLCHQSLGGAGGSTPRAPTARRPGRSVETRRCSGTTPGTTRMQATHSTLSPRRRPTGGASTTCTGTPGSGWRIGTPPTRKRRSVTRPVRRQARLVCCAGAPSTSRPGTCAPRSGSGRDHLRGGIVSGALWRGE